MGANKISSLFDTLNIRHFVMVFIVIVLGFGTIIIFANLTIQSNVENAHQTIKQVTITHDGTNDGTKYMEFNGSLPIYIKQGFLNSLPTYAGQYVLVINDTNGEVVTVPVSGLEIGSGSSTNAGTSTSDGFWTGTTAGNIRNINIGNVGIGTLTNTPNATLQVVGKFIAGSYSSTANGTNAVALGQGTQAGGGASTAMGNQSQTVGNNATAMGGQAKAIGNSSTAMGEKTTAVGIASVAMGYMTTGAGVYSTAMGWQTKAVGQASTAMGYMNTAGGNYSTAMGSSSQANGQASTAMGYGSTAGGNYATAMGYGSTAPGQASTAMGYGSQTNGDYATAMGYQAKAFGAISTAIGSSTQAEGTGSVAMGSSTSAMGVYSTTMGRGTQTWADYSTALGKYNLGYANSMFEVGIGTSLSARSNALTVWSEGGITVSDSSLTCWSAYYGTIKFDGTNFRGCTPSGWKQLNN